MTKGLGLHLFDQAFSYDIIWQSHTLQGVRLSEKRFAIVVKM